MTGSSGCYRFSSRTIPKLLVFYFNLCTPFLCYSFSYLSFTLAVSAFLTPYLLYIHRRMIHITLSRSYHARLRVSYTYTLFALYLLITSTLVVLTYLR